MGIPGLWDILGEGEVKSPAKLSTDHFRQHKRPLRVAIDEAGWRFHNLSDAQVAAIRQKVPEANPIEKAILWRVLKLMRMNIQPIFIFDGTSRPWKRGGVAGKIDWKKIDLLRKTLNMLKIPHHRAPAEAEAECAWLNELGIVDAVWTDDGDALMFGAKVLIKEHREGRGNTAKKSDTLVRIYRADVIEQKHRINRQGLILFALLSGGDYDTKGLPGCGPMAALKAAQIDNGRLGKILCETPLLQLHCFTESLREFFQMPGSPSVYVPPGYPRDLHVKNYREPKVSTSEQAHDLRGLKNGWYVPIDEAKLRPFLLAMFNFDTKAYLKHIVPLLLVRELVQTTPETVDKNLVFELDLRQKRGRDHNAECLERQITFNPKKCTELNLWTKPDNEAWAEGASCAIPSRPSPCRASPTGTKKRSASPAELSAATKRLFRDLHGEPTPEMIEPNNNNNEVTQEEESEEDENEEEDEEADFAYKPHAMQSNAIAEFYPETMAAGATTPIAPTSKPDEAASPDPEPSSPVSPKPTGAPSQPLAPTPGSLSCRWESCSRTFSGDNAATLLWVSLPCSYLISPLTLDQL
ncbi:unnamed protein product [Aureobasidium uvarum]|uniref:XPG-I domain-containing protein n=1 Tax=Aureobasidium uvarum TaxID=2773716 RepID=A0A9N8KKQ1_9PEZI|nr:unnamed protein product [Aureobasidium uvarum]